MCSPICNYKIGELRCDNGYDDNGCWMGAHCAFECPSDCPPVKTIECRSEETKCGGVDRGVDTNGCIQAESCILSVNGTGDDGYGCYNPCPFSCDVENGQTYCENESYNGCPKVGYCSESKMRGKNGERCPGFCRVWCDWRRRGEVTCNKGYDDNGCWLGMYCAIGNC